MPKPKRAINPSVSKPHPSRQWADKIRLHQYRKGPDKPLWEASFALPDGSWSSPVSTGTEEEFEAAMKAVEMRSRHESSGSYHPPVAGKGHTFGAAAARVLARRQKLRDEICKLEGWRAANRHISVINRIKQLDRFFGAQPVKTITGGHLRDFLDALPRRPAQSTVGSLAACWAEVMNEAVALQWCDPDFPRMSKRGFLPGEARPTFSRDEMLKIAHNLASDEEQDRIIRAYVAIAATTGIRPGLEMERIRVGQVSSPDGKTFAIRVLATRSKTKRQRTVAVFQNDVFDMHEIIRERLLNRAPDELLFGRAGQGRYCGKLPRCLAAFNERILPAFGLKTDPLTGEDRTAYSLRHYYATQAILRGIGVYEIAKQMGTSVEKIESNYGHVLAQQVHGKMSGADDKVGRLQAALRRQRPSEHPDAVNDDGDDGS
jgi:integrase